MDYNITIHLVTGINFINQINTNIFMVMLIWNEKKKVVWRNLANRIQKTDSNKGGTIKGYNDETVIKRLNSSIM